MDYIKFGKDISNLINIATETVWFYRQQYFFKGSQNLKKLITFIQELVPEFVELAGEEFLIEMGFGTMLDAQELDDEIVLADVLEAQMIPCLMNLVQQINQNIPIVEIDYSDKNVYPKLLLPSDEYVGCVYTPEYTASGEVTVRLDEKGASYYLCGNNNPYRDAISFVHGNMEEEKYQYVLFGAGFLYEAEILLSHRPDAFVTVVEEDAYLLKLLFKYRDVSHILQDERFSLVNSTFEDLISKTDLSEKCLWVRKPAMRHMQNDKSREALQSFFLKSMTIKEQAFVLEKEFRANTSGKFEIKSVEECKEHIEGKTVYLIAGGPSLDNSLSVLRERNDDSIIMCVGTSAAKLKNAGITPDFVIIIDISDNMYKQIHSNVDEEKTTLIYMISANAKAVLSFKGKKYAVCQKAFYMAEDFAKEHGFMLFETGGSVTTTAIDICIRLGCEKIVCLGMDMAYTGNKTHASGTLFEKVISTNSNSLMVKSVSGDMIPTTINLTSYRKWIENRLRNVKEIEFTNISDGAFISGMKNIPTGQYH